MQHTKAVQVTVKPETRLETLCSHLKSNRAVKELALKRVQLGLVHLRALGDLLASKPDANLAEPGRLDTTL